MKKAAIIAALLLVLLTTSLFLRGELLLLGCRLFLNHYLNYERVEWENECLIVVQPRPKADQEGAAWEAKELRLQPNFSQGVAIDATFVEPFIAIADPSAIIANLSFKQPSWVTSHLHVAFIGGKLALTPPNLPPLILKTEGELNQHCSFNGIFIVAIGPEEEQNRLFIDVRPEEQKTVIHFSAQSLDCPALSQILSCIEPEWMQHWVIEKGVLEGNWTASFPLKGPVSFVGEGILSDLRFAHLPSGAHGLLEKASLSFSSLSEGQLELLKPAHIELQGSPLAPCHFKDVKGGAFFQGERSTLQLEGELEYKTSSCRLKVSGYTYQDPTCQAALDLSWESQSDNTLASSSHFALYESSEGKQRLELHLQHIREEQALVLQTIASDLFPSCKLFQLHSGELSAKIQATIEQQQIQDIHVQDFSLSDAEFSLAPYFKHGKITHAAGECYATLNDQQLFSLKEGALTIEGSLLLTQEGGECIHELNEGRAKFLIHDGTLYEGNLSFGYKGLTTAISINQSSDNQLIEVLLSGDLIAAAPLLPAQLQSAIERHFKEDKLLLRTALHKKNSLIEVSGQCVLESSSKQRDLIPFSCQILKTSSPGKDPSQSFITPFLELLIDLPSNESSYCFSLENGRIYGEMLDLERYAALWNIFPPTFSVKGRVNVKGYFDQNGMTLYYEARDVALESPDLLMQMPVIGDLSPDTPLERQAFLYQDFKEAHQKGQIPISNASYLEKNHDLRFGQFSAMGKIDNSIIQLEQVKTECEEVRFEGKARIDNSNAAQTDLLLHADRFEGSLSNIQQLCSHLCDLPFWKLPAEGQVEAAGAGLELLFHFYQDETVFDAKVQGSLKEGSWKDSQKKLSLSHCAFGFSYRHETEQLDLFDMQGELLLPTGSLPFEVHSKLVRFTHFPEFNIEFDISAWAEGKEVLALCGKSSSLEGTEKELRLHPNSCHLGSTRITMEKCHFSTWDQLLTMQSHLQLDAQELYADMNLGTQFGLFPDISSLIEPFVGRELQGPIALSLAYSAENRAWGVKLEGDHLKIRGNAIDRLNIQGSFTENQWIIDQLQADQLSLQAALHKVSDGLKIDSLSIALGTHFNLQLRGLYEPKKEHLRAEVSSLNIDLEAKEWISSLHALIPLLRPHGVIHASGSIDIDFKEITPWGWRIEALTAVDLKGFELMGISFDNQGTLCALFSKDGILTLQGIDASISSQKEESEMQRLGVKVDTLSYGIESQDWKISDMRFYIPQPKIDKCATLLSNTFPEFITPYIAKAIRGLKQSEPLQGTLSASSTPSGAEVTLRLDDGSYFFKNEAYEIQECSLFLTAQDARIQWKFLFQDQPLWASAAMAAHAPSEGNLMINELSPLEWQKKNIEPLTISWEISPRDEILLKKVKGSCSGVKADLDVVSNGETLILQGSALLDWKNLQPLCSDALSQMVSRLKLGSGYTLHGKFFIPKKQFKDLSFEGNLTGNRYIFENYELKELQAQLSVSPAKVVIQSLKMSDEAGELTIDRCTAVKKEDNQWHFEMPSLKIVNLRPSLLHACNEKAAPRKPFVFTEIAVGRLSGQVNDIAHWKGVGSFTFRNIPKKNFLNTLWTIPDDLISTIGLDLGLLTPVRGSVDYLIKDGRIYLKRLRDVFSKNERSKFYLPDQHLRSYVDFDGNLNLRVRMKHYNLLFKLTELMTISIRGNIDKPIYSLKNSKDPKP